MISRDCPGAPVDPCPSSEPVVVGKLYPLYLRLGPQGVPRRVGNQMVDLELDHNITFQERYGNPDLITIDEWWVSWTTLVTAFGLSAYSTPWL